MTDLSSSFIKEVLSCLKCRLKASIAALVSFTSYPINAKAYGIEILFCKVKLVFGSYHSPYPFCANKDQGKLMFGSFFLVGAISPCPIK